MIFVPNQLVGAPIGTDATIDCHTEAYPRAMSYWFLGEEMILSNEKYTTTIMENSYRAHMRLIVRNLTTSDFGSYRCISKNSLGETEGSIRLYRKPMCTFHPRVSDGWTNLFVHFPSPSLSLHPFLFSLFPRASIRANGARSTRDITARRNSSRTEFAT